MRVGSKLLLVATVAAVAGPLPALAKKADFISCDGLQAPNKSGNGMRPRPDHLYGNRPFTVTACNAALADPRLLPTHAPRRANLLRARAIGHLAAGNADEALADIDAAQEAAKEFLSDPMFARSMGISFDLVRAAAWQRKGDLARSRQLALAAGDARPYSLAVQSLVISFLNTPNGQIDQQSPYARVLPLNPEAIYEEFFWLIQQRRFSEALQVYPRLKLEFPQLQPFSREALHVGNPQDPNTLTSSTAYSLFAAYAYAVTGDTDTARSLLTDTQAKVEAALAPLTAAGQILRARDVKFIIEKVGLLVSGRIDIEQGNTANVIKSLVGQQLPDSPLTVEFFTALKKALPAEQKELAPDPAPIAAKIVENARHSGQKIGMLIEHLPAAEFSDQNVDYKQSKKSILNAFAPSGYEPDGFRSEEDPATGIITVEFIGSNASAAAVDELTLLHAADLARQKGKSGFVITSRNLYSRTMKVTVGGAPKSSTPVGFQAELGIRIVDPNNLPADLQSERDRIIDANRVYEVLAPIYNPPEHVKSS